MTFVLEAVRTLEGSALLLNYGPQSEPPSRILIDCGANGSYAATIRPKLDQLCADDGQPVPLHMVLVSQTDTAHLNEMALLLKDVLSGTAPAQPEMLWLNVPTKASDDATTIAKDIRKMAQDMGIHLNPPFVPPWITSSTQSIAQGHGLGIEVLSPHGQPDTIDAAAPIVLMHKGDQSMLIAGNAPGPRIVNALVQAGYLDKSEDYPPAGANSKAESKSVTDPFHVNLMAITQHGKDRHLTPGFFRHVTADSYLFAGNATGDNPMADTLRAIAEARGKDEFNVYFSITADGPDGGASKQEVLDWVANEMPDGCAALFRQNAPDRHSIRVELPA